MYLLLTTYKVAPMTFWDYAIPLIIVLFLIYICVRIDAQLKREKRSQEQRAKRYKRIQAQKQATPLPSEPIAV